MGSLPGVRVLRSLAKANARLTAAIVAVGVVSGLLAPAFAVATGFLVRAIRSHGSVALPLGAILVVFGIGRLLDPAREQLGDAMWRQLDASVSRRPERCPPSCRAGSRRSSAASSTAVSTCRSGSGRRWRFAGR